MNILIDTNVIMDEFLDREPFCEESRKIIQMCADEKINGFLAAHTVTNLFYTLRKDFTVAKRREMLLGLFEFFTVVEIDSSKLIMALLNEDFKDFEDCLQSECATAINADYIITRNKKDFAESKIPCATPVEFIELLEGEE